MGEFGGLTSEWLFGLPLPTLWFGLVLFALGAFLLLDGFDFGIGVLFATGSKSERERLLAVIGPFWDGNEVWLVVFGGLLFAAFPSAYASLFSRYYLLTFGILAGLGLRGLAPELYEQRDDVRWRRLWGGAFVVGSTLTPFLFGLLLVNWVTGATATLTLHGVFGGLALLAFCVLDGVAFCQLKTPGPLAVRMRVHGLRAGIAYLALLLVSLAVSGVDLQSLVVLGCVFASVLLIGTYSWALRRDRPVGAFVAVGGVALVLLVLFGGLAFPYIDRGAGLTIQDAFISPLMANLMTIATAFLLPLVLSYFVVLYSAFSGPIESEESYG